MEPIIRAEKPEHKSDILTALEKAVNDEILAAFQYWTAYHMTAGPGKYDADPMFEEHAKQEWEHVELLTQRIKELGGKLTTDPNNIRANATEWYPVTTGDVKHLAKLIHEAEQRAAEKYSRLAFATMDSDPGTYRIILQILATEQEHEYELHKLRESLE